MTAGLRDATPRCREGRLAKTRSIGSRQPVGSRPLSSGVSIHRGGKSDEAVAGSRAPRSARLTSYQDSLWEEVPEGLDPPDLELRLAFLLERAAAAGAHAGRPPRVLDVGCGEGRFASELARAGMTVVGV